MTLHPRPSQTSQNGIVHQPVALPSTRPVSLAVQNKKPLERSLLERILEVSRHMAETRMLKPLLEYVIDQAVDLSGAERGYIVLIQPDNSFKIQAMRAQPGKALDDSDDKISHSVLKKVLDTAHPLIVHDALNDPEFDFTKSVIKLQLRSIMCVPLMARGDVIGAIYVENRSIRNRFREDAVPPLMIFANQAAVAIENATLNDELEARVLARTRELQKSWSEIVESNRLRTVWLSNMSHDLRAPLGIAVTALSLIQEEGLGSLTDTQQEWIGKSLSAVQHAVNLLNDIFYFFKLEGGGIELRREMVPIRRFLQDVYEVALGLPWAEQVKLKLALAGDLPEVCIDPLRIRQVLLNLLTNAQKFTGQGQVTLYAKRLDNNLLVGVKDTGEGIPTDKLDRLFQRFQQVDDNMPRRQRGSGLGLAISRELVEMHSGRISVKSRPGRGSNFFFILPLPDEA